MVNAGDRNVPTHYSKQREWIIIQTTPSYLTNNHIICKIEKQTQKNL